MVMASTCRTFIESLLVEGRDCFVVSAAVETDGLTPEVIEAYATEMARLIRVAMTKAMEESHK